MRHTVRHLVLWVGLGCNPEPANPPSDPPLSETDPAEGAAADLIPRQRLSRVELRQEAIALLGVDSPAIDNLPADPTFGGLRTVASALDVSSYLIDGWAAAASDLARRAVEGPGWTPSPVMHTVWFRHYAPEGSFLDTNQMLSDRLLPELHVWRDTPVAVVVEATAAGRHALGVVACVPGSFLEAAELRVALDGETVLEATVDAQCGAPAQLAVDVEIEAGPRTLSVQLLNGHDGVGVVEEPTSIWNPNVQAAIVLLQASLRGPTDLDGGLPPIGTALLRCEPGAARCVQDLITGLAARAWRRPLRDDEREGLASLVGDALADGLPAGEAAQFGVRAVLMSPHFLFRLETHADGEHAAPSDPLYAYEIAARLSLFLWRSGPDEELTGCAQSGALLDEPEGACGLAAQATRLLNDPRTDALVAELVDTWLGLEDLVSADRFDKRFTREIAALMRQEARLLLGHYLREPLPWAGVLDHPQSWVNDTLADYYGLPLPGSGALLTAVALPSDGRRGLVQLGGTLVAGSNEYRTIPALRATWILEALYCTETGPPPADFTLPEDLSAAEALEAHLDPACASCHRLLDPLGLSLEPWGPTGRWREQDDHGGPIAVDVVLPSGQALDSPAALAIALREDPEVRACLVRKVLALATGTEVGSADATGAQKQAAATLVEALPNDPSFADITAALLVAPMFTHREEAP